jgi:hypothetical protein
MNRIRDLADAAQRERSVQLAGSSPGGPQETRFAALPWLPFAAALLVAAATAALACPDPLARPMLPLRAGMRAVFFVSLASTGFSPRRTGARRRVPACCASRRPGTTSRRPTARP